MSHSLWRHRVWVILWFDAEGGDLLEDFVVEVVVVVGNKTRVVATRPVWVGNVVRAPSSFWTASGFDGPTVFSNWTKSRSRRRPCSRLNKSKYSALIGSDKSRSLIGQLTLYELSDLGDGFDSDREVGIKVGTNPPCELIFNWISCWTWDWTGWTGWTAWIGSFHLDWNWG